MKKTKSEKQSQIVHLVLTPLLGFGVARKQNQKTKCAASDRAGACARYSCDDHASSKKYFDRGFCRGDGIALRKRAKKTVGKAVRPCYWKRCKPHGYRSGERRQRARFVFQKRRNTHDAA